MKLSHHAFMFYMGIRDSISIQWVWQLLLYADPSNKRIHPSSTKMLLILRNSLVQVIIFLIGLPGIFRILGYNYISYFLDLLFLLLTYGYLFFYNDDIITYTKQIALWKLKRYPNSLAPLDHKEKIQMFTSLSSQLKSFIFLILYYTPILAINILLNSYLPIIGPILLLLSQSFFNAAFYFLKKWPYDRYNIGFIQHNLAYMLGYGMLVSFCCNLLLSGSLSRGAYFLLSQWMIINCVLYSPPSEKIYSIQELCEALTNRKKRSSFTNGYNEHRERIRQSSDYRKQIISQIMLVSPAMKITQLLNKRLQKAFFPTKINKDYNSIKEVSESQQ